MWHDRIFRTLRWLLCPFKIVINYQKNTYAGQFSISVFSEVLNKRLATSLRMNFQSLLLQRFQLKLKEQKQSPDVL